MPEPERVSCCKLLVGDPEIVNMPDELVVADLPAYCTVTPCRALPVNWFTSWPARRTVPEDAGTVMVVVTVTDPAVPAANFTFVEYVPALLPERLTEIETVFCELAAIVPDTALRASQPTPSVAVQDNDWLPLFFSVTERLVAVVPKSSWTGVTAKVVLPDAATFIFTLTVSVPPPEEIVTPVA